MTYKIGDIVTVKNNKFNDEEIIEGTAIIRGVLTDIDNAYLVAFEITNDCGDGTPVYEGQTVERRVI